MRLGGAHPDISTISVERDSFGGRTAAAVDVEVVFGHAWKVPTAATVRLASPFNS
jgi:hypothetical protein